jgi:integrase
MTRRPRVRGNGDGTVFRDPNPRRKLPYRAECTVGWTDAGRPIRKARYAASRKLAVKALADLLRERDLGLAGPDSTLSTYLAGWLETLDVAPRTRISYAHHVEAYWSPMLGERRIRALTPTEIRIALGQVEHSAGTRTRILATLRTALAAAVREGILERNPAASVSPPRRAVSERTALTAEQARAFLASVAGDRLSALYLLAIVTGMRQGELLGLAWTDIAGDRITVRSALASLVVYGADGEPLRDAKGRMIHEYVLVPPKSASGRRTIVLGETAVAALRAHKARQAAERLASGSAWRERGLVFVRADGEALSASVVTHAFQSHLAAAGLPRMPFHSLRHTAASLMVEATGDLKMAQAVLGHATIGLTADTYTHIQDSQLRRAASALDAVVGGKG